MKRLGILLSGRGSNFLAIHRAIDEHRLHAEIAVVLSNLEIRPRPRLRTRARPPHLRHPLRRPQARRPRRRDDRPPPPAPSRSRLPRRIHAHHLARLRRSLPQPHPQRPPLAAPRLPRPRRPAAGLRLRSQGRRLHRPLRRRGRRSRRHHPAKKPSPSSTTDTPETLSARILEQEHIAYPEAIARVLSGDYTIQDRRYIHNTAETDHPDKPESLSLPKTCQAPNLFCFRSWQVSPSPTS